jgi:hypothetical protein
VAIRARLVSVASCFWLKGFLPLRCRTGAFGEVMRKGGSDRRTHWVVGEHYPDRNAG